LKTWGLPMDSNDTGKFSNAMGVMCEVFSKALSPLAIQTYFRAMERFPIEQVEGAISEAIVSCRFFPKPVELIEFITGKSGNLADIAEIQAAEVLQTVKRYGAYNSIRFRDTVTAAVIQQSFGGWKKLCDDLRNDNEKWFLKDFVRTYQAYSRQGIEYKGILAGQIATDNSARGYDNFISEPLVVGISKEIKYKTDNELPLIRQEN
jgi:hypothetical protein